MDIDIMLGIILTFVTVVFFLEGIVISYVWLRHYGGRNQDTHEAESARPDDRGVLHVPTVQEDVGGGLGPSRQA